jgi:hypothetical protein
VQCINARLCWEAVNTSEYVSSIRQRGIIDFHDRKIIVFTKARVRTPWKILGTNSERNRHM